MNIKISMGQNTLGNRCFISGILKNIVANADMASLYMAYYAIYAYTVLYCTVL